MDAKANIRSSLTSRRATDGCERLGHGAIVRTADCGIADNLSARVEIFKKTPCIAGLKLAGPDVAKDIAEFATIPMPTNLLPEPSDLHGDRFAVMGGTGAETANVVNRETHQNVVRSANKLIAQAGDIVGVKGIRDTLAGEGPARAGAGTFNAKLTDKELAMRPTKSGARATNHTSGTLWNYARQMGAAGIGAVSKTGRAHEKQYYADI